MGSVYKLSYFESRGVAEPIRLIFAYKGIEYTDMRYSFMGNWAAKKNDTPWGSLPILEIDDKVLPQSHAIQRYLAKLYKLDGENDFESAKCDELVEAMTDLRKSAFGMIFEMDKTKQSQAKETLKKETFPFYLKKFSEILEKNNGSKYFVGKTLTYADLNLANFLQIFSDNKMFDLNLSDYPLLEAHQQTVFNTPGIKEWVEKRPKTDY